MKTLASPANYGIYVPQITGSTIGEGSMKTANTGTVVPLKKSPFKAFPSRPALYAGRLLTVFLKAFNSFPWHVLCSILKSKINWLKL